MTSKRVYYLLLGLMLLLTVGIIGGAYGTNSLLAKQSQKLVAQKSKLVAAQNEQTELTQSKKDIATYTDLYNISRVIVPQNKDQTQTVRQIIDLAAANNITIASITFPPSTLGNQAGASSAGAPAQATPTGAAAAVAGPVPSQLVAVPSIPGVYNLNLQVTSSSDIHSLASFPDMINFLAALEQNRLTALVSKITIAPSGTEANAYSFTLSLNIYIKPGK